MSTQVPVTTPIPLPGRSGQPGTDPPRPRSALLYGDMNLNLIDGSTIWLQSMTELLSRAGCAVTLVLKSPVRTERLVAPLATLPGVTIRRPYEEGMVEAPGESGLSHAQASRLLAQVDAEHRHDLIMVRGWAVAARIVADGAFTGRLWAYLTDIPQSVPSMTDAAAASLGRIAQASRYLLFQTEDMRCFVEQSVPEACGKSLLIPPIVLPPAFRRPGGPPPGDRPLRLVYMGKFAPLWNTYEMTQLPRLLAARGLDAQLHMVGDKIHRDPADPGWERRMRSALGPLRASWAETAAGTGVIWRGGQPHEAATRIAASCDIGLSWRAEELDASLELSTKLLEYGSVRLAVVLNRTPVHQDLFGAGYPLFASDLPEVANAVELAARDPAVYAAAAAAIAAAAEEFSLARTVRRFGGYLARAFPPPLQDTMSADKAVGADQTAAGGTPGLTAARPLRVVAAGHDMRFFAPLRDHFEQTLDIELRVDQWAAFDQHDPAVSRSAAQWADVIICEWCGPNAVWYSRNKRPGSRLLVRLHRFEASRAYPRQLQISEVDQVVCVNDHFARICHEAFSWPGEKITAVPVAIDTAQLDRPKLEGADHQLGMVGIVPALKRLDLALDILEQLRRDDDSYVLSIKSWLPWNHDWWVWKRTEERDYYADVLRRIQRSPLLREAVVFDDAGPDIAAWLRRVGFILSTSETEGFHTALAEGMASRAVPVVRHWPGAETLYDTRWIYADAADMAASIAMLRGAARQQAGDAAHEDVQPFSRERVQMLWRALLTANLPSVALPRKSDADLFPAPGCCLAAATRRVPTDRACCNIRRPGYQPSRWTTSPKGRRLGFLIGATGRSAG
jgi:glycosyltransferase involved in cell wall biosynthesis